MSSTRSSTSPTPSSPSAGSSARHGPSTGGTAARPGDHDHPPIRAASKEKLIAIRDIRAGIRRDIDRLDAELETGRQVFLLALDLLDQPQELYRQAGPALRKTMNQTIFTKLMLDGAMVATDELAEPFDVIVPAGRAYDDPTYYRERPPALTGVVLHEGVSADDLTLTDRLQLAQGGKGCSKPVMVDRGRRAGQPGELPVPPGEYRLGIDLDARALALAREIGDRHA